MQWTILFHCWHLLHLSMTSLLLLFTRILVPLSLNSQNYGLKKIFKCFLDSNGFFFNKLYNPCRHEFEGHTRLHCPTLCKQTNGYSTWCYYEVYKDLLYLVNKSYNLRNTHSTDCWNGMDLLYILHTVKLIHQYWKGYISTSQFHLH